MARPPRARMKVLDAFADILLAEGERAATLEATAQAAGVSKGGLLYHFGSKEELAGGLVDRLAELVSEDIAEMTTAPEGVVSYYLRTSVMDGSPLDLVLAAVSRLAQSGHSPAAAAIHEARRRWADTLRPHVRDETALNLVLLLGDGIYFMNAVGEARNVPAGAAFDSLLELVGRTVAD